MAVGSHTYSFVADDIEFSDEDIISFRVVETVSGLQHSLLDTPPPFAFHPSDVAPPTWSPFQDYKVPHIDPTLGLAEGQRPPYYIWIRTRVLSSALKVEDMLHKHAALTVGKMLDSRTFHGEIFRVRHVSASVEAKTAYDFYIYPWLWYLAFTRKSRVWSGNIVDIFNDIVKSYPSSMTAKAVIDSSKLSSQPPNRELLIQYNESDYSFVHRNLERDGIFYYIVNDQSGYKLVLGQENADFLEGELNNRSLALSESAEPDANEPSDVVSDLIYEAQTVPEQYAMRDYNPENASATLHAKVPSGDKAVQVYQFPGMFEELSDGVDNISPRRFKAQQANKLLALGASQCQFMAAGEKVNLPFNLRWGTPQEFSNGAFFVRQAVHDMARRMQDNVPIFRNIFEAQKMDYEYGPAQLTPYPELNAPHVAIVETASGGEEVDFDQHSRPQVSFKWDAAKTKVRLRLGQGWAGATHGMQVLPRLGDEVLVMFIDSHPDRPIIVGSVYNSRSKMLYDPTKSNEFSAITEASGPYRRLTGMHDAGGNQVLLFDAKGAQRLVTTAGKDRDDLVANRWTTASYQTVEYVHDSKTEEIGGDYTLTIGGNMSVLVKGDVTVTIGGSVNFKIDS